MTAHARDTRKYINTTSDGNLCYILFVLNERKNKSLLQDIDKSQVIKVIYSDHYNSLVVLSLFLIAKKNEHIEKKTLYDNMGSSTFTNIFPKIKKDTINEFA